MLIFRQKRVTGQRLRLRTLVLKPDFTQKKKKKNFLNNPFYFILFIYLFYLDGNIIYIKDPCILQILTSKRRLKYESNNFHFPALFFYPFYPLRVRKKTQNKINSK